ncbi:hypothetical protein DFJ63DRAFT_99752 [Scheffersomyces coipomensis]|uniref:uncharacterized protein n=1 Tax=Scheffersomyces coipomensis TaxID=1788519 RepID=UPI00315D4C50
MSTTTVANIDSEKQFAETYVKLIALSNDAAPSQFNSTSDYHKLESLGPSLPKFKFSLPKSESKNKGLKVNLKFKSIKPPYKFTAELNNVHISTTILKVKSDLIDSLPLLKDGNITPVNLKVLHKSKVVQDGSELSSIYNQESEITFSCLVSAPTVTATTPAATTEEVADIEMTNAETETSTKSLQVSDSTWNKIYELLVQDVGQANAHIVQTKFKESLQ